ncbi:hypothetical protein HYW67_03440 [Candidatus Parcubacteria bacterium]|nr:hypothetical protein [Candidatus Parcubacteria bacterium]
MINSSLQVVAAEIVGALAKRTRDIISGRFGLKDGKRKTLEAIGDGFGITRERVRQIEADGLTVLRKPEVMAKIASYATAMSQHLADHGNVRREDQFLVDIAQMFGADTPQERAAATLILTLAGEAARQRDDDEFYTLWYVGAEALAAARKAVAMLSDTFTNDRRTISEEELANRAGRVAQSLSGATAKTVLSYVDASRLVERNPFGEWGPAHWPEVKPRGVKDKAYLIFKRAAKPLHFREVAEHINSSIAKRRPAHPQTVHNELIKDKRFVLVGRGTYALAEWGYQPGTVREVLLAVLRENGRPMTKEELLAEVLRRRFVKENTVLLNLQHRSFFVRTGEGKYAVKTA